MSTENDVAVVQSQRQYNLRHALLAGAIAGTAVDSALFPLDTIKTRLQSQAGFLASGGLRGVYAGLFAAVLGSAPSASMFFVTYEAMKRVLRASADEKRYAVGIHMMAASMGEVTACIVRVPTEVIKQRMQTKQFGTVGSALSHVIRTEGLLGLYRGFLSTVVREIPFTCIQFPLYEHIKQSYGIYQGRMVEPYEAAICGSFAGGVAAALTTPLDVCKTRIMLSHKETTPHNTTQPYTGILSTMKRISAEEGPRALYKGVGPRVIWISLGGSVFLGVYEQAVKTISTLSPN